jgi:hypothetical protein
MRRLESSANPLIRVRTLLICFNYFAVFLLWITLWMPFISYCGAHGLQSSS